MSSNNNEKDTDHGTILDSIKEQTTNIEAYTSKRSFDLTIGEELKKFALKERNTRESTLVVKNTEKFDKDGIVEIVEREWVNNGSRISPTFWSDKIQTYIQFNNKCDRDEFLTKVQTSNNHGLGKLNGLISKENKSGNHFTRKEVKIEITNVREEVEPNKVNQILKDMSNDVVTFSEVKGGKVYGPTGRKQRSLMFKTNAAGFLTIFDDLNGVIPYNNLRNKLTIKLWPRVNARPWSCKECYFIGPNHNNCPGQSCAQCGLKNHITKACKARTRRCTNCKRNGHRAKDHYCPIYIREIIKEIKRMDIPLEYLEDDTKRFDLIKSLIYK